MDNRLSAYFSLNRRYTRSINVARDLQQLSALEGYIPTERSLYALRRIIAGMDNPESHRAWTLTSVYGTGKSAFAQYLAALVAPINHPLRQMALKMAETSLGAESSEGQFLKNRIPSQGLFRAVVAAQREPLSHTIIRALYQGAEIFWPLAKRNQISVARQLVDFYEEINAGKPISSRRIPRLIQEVAAAAETGILLIIDELGKNLEFATYNQGDEDLYLLQQLAELPKNEGTELYIIGILHQSFADYGERLSSVQRNEWAKIQGRFEDIAFQDSPAQMMQLIGQAIDASKAEIFQCAIANQWVEWHNSLPKDISAEISAKVLASTYPLHPITALVLPMLCTRYAQNDRSIFTFLTSSEPYSFQSFLEETEKAVDSLPTLKLDRVYDYFIEAVGLGLANRANLQKWVEIQGLIADAKRLDSDTLRVLKAIGTLNLVTSTGAMRASRTLVALAMCDSANDSEMGYWNGKIETLIKQGMITHRRQLDELRIWQGSDFNIDQAIADYLGKERSHLVDLLAEIRYLKPMVAQRHSYQTGTLRYFESLYLDSRTNFANLFCSSSDADGLVGYWIDQNLPDIVPENTADGKPLVILSAVKLDLLEMRAREFAALKKIQLSEPKLQNDGVARREVRYRVVEAEQLLDETLSQVFDVAANQNPCWVLGKLERITRSKDLNVKLSEVCDRIYPTGITLWNELINRRELTSQGAKARRELIEAMLECSEKEQLGLEGYGPEVSIYHSVLGESGIHKKVGEEWGFYPPEEKSGLATIWQVIENFCLQAKEKQQTLDLLYQQLQAPPFGVKQGVIPILLAAVWLYHVDDVGIYRDGSFIPVLGAEHFELLLKDPTRFAVKYFEVIGLRSQVFKELETILRSPNPQALSEFRNATLLAVVRPLFQFVKKLPNYTKKTKRLSAEALAVLQTLQQAQEPDELLFTSLPKACGLSPIVASDEDDGTIAKTLRKKLVTALHEIQTASDRLLTECQSFLYTAFGVRSNEDKLREDLRVRASYLAGQSLERRINSFVVAAVDENLEDAEWLEALVMNVADKPAKSWTDEDVTNFEVRLSDIARRFKNLEAIQRDGETRQKEGFEARKITVTRPDGQETHSLVWFERENQTQIDNVISEILIILDKYDNPQLKQAVVAKLTERILGSDAQDGLAKLEEKRQQRKDERKTS